MVKRTSMSNPNQYKNEKPFRIRRGRVDSVDLYEVKENELEMLENGEPTGIHLNFAIFLLSIAISCIIGLCTATFDSSLVENAFLFISIIGVIGGIFLGILWWRGRKSIKTIISKIKNRIPIEPSEISSSSNEDTENNNDEFAPKG
jgi:hypothetical protein